MPEEGPDEGLEMRAPAASVNPEADPTTVPCVEPEPYNSDEEDEPLAVWCLKKEPIDRGVAPVKSCCR
jgi:hypothetical protein